MNNSESVGREQERERGRNELIDLVKNTYIEMKQMVQVLCQRI